MDISKAISWQPFKALSFFFVLKFLTEIINLRGKVGIFLITGVLVVRISVISWNPFLISDDSSYKDFC